MVFAALMFATPAGAATSEPVHANLYVTGAARVVSWDGYDTRVEVDVRCFSFGGIRQCQQDDPEVDAQIAGRVRVSQQRDGTTVRVSMVPFCIQFNRGSGVPVDLVTMSGPAKNNDGSPAGRLTLAFADFHHAQPDRVYVDLVNTTVPPFCPNAFRHGTDGAAISAGNIVIRHPE
jgi:hypothetical protein